MTEKKTKSAPPAKEEKKSEPEEAPAEAPSAPVVPEAAAPIQIPPKVLEQAEALGVDLQQIVDWAQSVEQKFVIVEKNFKIIGDSIEQLKPLIQLSQQIQQRQTAATGATAGTPAGSFDLGSLMQFLPALLSGGGSNPLGDELTKKVIDAGLDQMFAGTQLLKAMQTKILAGLGAKEIQKALET